MSTQPREQRRPYRSGRRAEAAAGPRAAILDAALRLFVEHGYAKVTIGDIAHAADTAVPTVYASTGGKSAILATLISEGVQDPVVEQTLAAVRASHDPREAIAATAHGVRVDNESHVDLVRVLITAAMVDETAMKSLTDSDDAYRQALAVLTGRPAALGALRPGLDRDRATDILWHLLGHHSWRILVTDCGWSWDDAETWLRGQVSSALLTG